MTAALTPYELVLNALSLQKWATDFRDLETLQRLYTIDSTQVINRIGPEGRTEIARYAGRDAIIANLTGRWAASGGTWFPGALIHQIGSVVAEPIDDGRFRVRSYASILGLRDNAAGLQGYGTYDDLWALDDGEWRLADREMALYGYALAPR